MAIKPISLPGAAGLDYSGHDVRHFAQGDAVNVPGLSNPTRNLAERDNILAETLNEVVSVVNNREQFVPLPVIRTMIPPNEQVIVTNYRIPAGFEARVLNAVVSSTLGTTDAELDIMYSESYGGSAGTTVVSVTPGSEFTGDVNFYQVGEFIVSLKNTGVATLEITASVMLTMRPLGAEGTLLVGSIIEGAEGQPGMRGGIGPAGLPGTGGAGSPGMNWKGNWLNGASYIPNDTVSYSYSGTYGSWICRVANTGNLGVNDPQVDLVTWNHVAFGIIGGVSVGLVWRGAWSDVTVYAVNDAVSFDINGISSSYICTAAVGPSGSDPSVDGAHWGIIAGPTTQTPPTYSVDQVPGTFYYDAGYQAGAPNGDYVSAGGPSSVGTALFNESVLVNSSVTPYGVAFIQYQQRSVFSGTVVIALPQSSGDGAAVDWNSGTVHCLLTLDGTAASSPDPLVKITATAAGSYAVVVSNSVPVMSTLEITGFQQIV